MKGSTRQDNTSVEKASTHLPRRVIIERRVCEGQHVHRIKQHELQILSSNIADKLSNKGDRRKEQKR